jgi:hypothetical protein
LEENTKSKERKIKRVSDQAIVVMLYNGIEKVIAITLNNEKAKDFCVSS